MYLNVLYGCVNFAHSIFFFLKLFSFLTIEKWMCDDYLRIIRVFGCEISIGNVHVSSRLRLKLFLILAKWWEHTWPYVLLYHSGVLPLKWGTKISDTISTISIFSLLAYLMSTRDKCIIFERPLPHGSIKYRDASTTPLTPPNSKLAWAWSTDVSTMTQAPRGKSERQDLQAINEVSHNHNPNQTAKKRYLNTQ